MKKNDLILIFGILILSLFFYGGMKLWQKGNTDDSAYVEVKIDGELYGTYPLDEDIRERIDSADGGYNILVISDGKASIEEANCPDKICVNHRAIHYSGDSVVCLPHKLTVKVIGGQDSEIDAATN
ncbi:MAG: NusG domain II-containing protein [Pseudobutyrivibrio sp.]|nr:NusG domain II-containing protein [Pseudobutyrivibrio sp.]